MTSGNVPLLAALYAYAHSGLLRPFELCDDTLAWILRYIRRPAGKYAVSCAYTIFTEVAPELLGVDWYMKIMASLVTRGADKSTRDWLHYLILSEAHEHDILVFDG